MVALLKASKRAILVGSPTNGTGAGLVGINQDNSIAKFRDSFNQIEVDVPNYLFGVAKAPVGEEQNGHILRFSENMDLLLENKPTQPDVPFHLSVDDLREQTEGWLDITLRVLSDPGYFTKTK
jgi:hypothetical protein